MMYRILYQTQKTIEKRLKKQLEREQRKSNRYIRLYRINKRALRKARKATAELDDYVVGWCLHCENQTTMLWNPEKDGLTAYCPHCGGRMMLCDNCQGECDYDGKTDTCKEM